MATRVVEEQEILGTEAPSEVEWVRQVQQGLPVEAIARLREFGGLSEADLDEVIPRRTRRHQRERGRLSPEQSDRVARAARAFAMAHRAFGDPEKANRWMKRPHQELGGERPISLLRSSTGARLVEDVLGRIVHGVYA